MGIYIFNFDTLKNYLIQNEMDTGATKDFGKNIIPDMLKHNEKLIAYKFEGYWKDVGTIDSLWEANMDLLNPNVPLDLYDPSWKIYSRNPILPPHTAGSNACIQNSMVTEGSYIDGTVDFSMIFEGVTIETDAVVRDSIIMPGAVIKSGAQIEYAIVGENSVVEKNAVIGARPETTLNKNEWGIAVIGNDLKISPDTVVAPKQIISESI
jgi:glucose-1-phosphate adenylyltransferase